MNAVTKQDVQQAVERSVASIGSRMISKDDVQSAVNNVRNGIMQDLKELHSENQSQMRNSQARHDQMNQRITTIERQLQILVHEVAKIADTTSRTKTSAGTQPNNQGFTFQRI